MKTPKYERLLQAAQEAGLNVIIVQREHRNWSDFKPPFQAIKQQYGGSLDRGNPLLNDLDLSLKNKSVTIGKVPESFQGKIDIAAQLNGSPIIVIRRDLPNLIISMGLFIEELVVNAVLLKKS